MRSITVAPLILAACGASLGGSRAGVLNYAQVHALREGMAPGEVTRQFGPPESRRTFDDGSLALAYRAENAAGEVEELRIAFGKEGLTRWTLAARK